jgi:hypothetical protein
MAKITSIVFDLKRDNRKLKAVYKSVLEVFKEFHLTEGEGVSVLMTLLCDLIDAVELDQEGRQLLANHLVNRPSQGEKLN